MPTTLSRLILAAACCFPLAATAQSTAQSTATPPAADAPGAPGADTKVATDDKASKIQSVEVKGKSTDYDPRRDDTASKTVLNADEIRKYGDDNIYDVLARAPGVTVTGKTLRMRGLGAGYTQILVNGDRPPPGFSIDNLTPDQIDRIEIIRAASAEYSMQAIAGTINIVLRRVVTKPQRDARIAYFKSPLTRGESAGGTWGEKRGDVSWILNANAYDGHNLSTSNGTDVFNLPDGPLTQSRLTQYAGAGGYHGVILLPRVNWKVDPANELNISFAAQKGRSYWAGASHNDDLVGSFGDPDWIDNRSRTSSEQSMLRGEVNWVARIAGGKLDLTLADEHGRNDDISDNDFSDAGAADRLVRNWDTAVHARREVARGKFSRSLFDGHAVVAGFDTSRQSEDDVRVRDETLDDVATHIVETFDPQITRLAAFVQDEWNVTKQWSVYMGARWEGVRTDSVASDLPDTHSNSHVLSPVAQTLYKFPDASGQQLRLALTRTYKAPTIDQLTARRYESPLNTRFAPDSSGNPALQPELATGIDAGYERYWPTGAMVSLSGSRRMISDYIRTELDQDPDGRWIYRPLNEGSARVHTLEAEVKLPAKSLGAAALANVDLRASVSRNWSTVSTVPGPDNRLDGQTPLSATVGVDWRRDRLSLGASMAFQEGGWVRVSEQQSTLQQTRRNLDAYALWKFDARFQLRLALTNILGMDQTSQSAYADASGTSRETSFQRGAMRTGLNLEMKL